MKKIYLLFLVLSFVGSLANAQTNAMDFTKTDCKGQTHHLFSELDPGNVVIMEFFHTCISCVVAANAIKPVYQKLSAQYKNRVSFYVMPADDDYSCASVLNWVSTNGFTSVVTPFDSGSVQTAYYGGAGMPSIVVAAGNKHKILYLANQTVSFATGDTAIIDTAIRHFLDSTLAGVPHTDMGVSANVFPNPVGNNFVLSLSVKEPGMLKLELTNITGQRVCGLTEEKIQAGIWSRAFPVSLPDGVYFIKGNFNEKPFQEKITVLH